MGGSELSVIQLCCLSWVGQRGRPCPMALAEAGEEGSSLIRGRSEAEKCWECVSWSNVGETQPGVSLLSPAVLLPAVVRVMGFFKPEIKMKMAHLAPTSAQAGPEDGGNSSLRAQQERGWLWALFLSLCLRWSIFCWQNSWFSFLFFFLHVFYVAVGCFLAEVRHQTWFWVEQCLKNCSKSQSRLSRLGGSVVCTGSWGCRACLPKEYPFFGKGYETKVRK